jgi:hypothetical protein
MELYPRMAWIVALSVWQCTTLNIEGQSAVVKSYLGCFIDAETRDLSSVLSNGQVSVEQCNKYCSSYQFFGLQATDYCLCGNSYGRYGPPVAGSECNMPCSGNAKQICGNHWRNSVYRVNNYVGCFKDTAIRDLSNVLFNGKVSIEQCRELCSNYTYFGLQATNNCLCGNSYGRYGQVAESECNKPCSGNAGQICGNNWRNSVYRVNTYLGCFKDTETRDLPNGLFFGQMSIQLCSKYCSNYQYFGLQATHHCLCGNSYGLYGQVPESECNKPCSGNANQICGNDWRNSIYRQR